MICAILSMFLADVIDMILLSPIIPVRGGVAKLDNCRDNPIKRNSVLMSLGLRKRQVIHV